MSVKKARRRPAHPAPQFEYQISVLMPSIRRDLLEGVYNSIAASYSGAWELVIVSPYPLSNKLKDKKNILYIEDHGSPIRARQIGLIAARGRYICYAADDVLFYPKALDLAMAKLFRKDYRRIILGKYVEGDPNSTYMLSHTYYQLITHGFLTPTMSRIPNGDKYWLLNTGLISTQLMKEIGGFDCSFEACAMACVDLSIRLQNYGVQIIVQDEPFFHSTHLPGIIGDHEPIHVAQTTHDMPLFLEMYKGEGIGRMKIDLNNWEKTPDWWSRRFGEKTSQRVGP